MKISNLNVALLVDSPQTGKGISAHLRQLEIMSDYHRKLDEFWLGLDRFRYDLLILDSKLLKEGSLSLLEHEKIKSHSLPIVIYLNGTTPIKEVIDFQNHCFCIGVIRDDLPWELQMRPFLLNLTQKRIQNLRLMNTEKKVEEYRDRVSSMVEKLETSKEFLDQHLLFYQVYDKAQENLNSMPFLSACLSAFNDLLPLDKVSCLVLSSHSKQLFSPAIKQSNYRQLPSINIEEDASKGINQSLSLKAREIVHQTFGNNHIELQVSGQHDQASLIFYLELNQVDENSLPWRVLENFLTSLYRSELMDRMQLKDDSFNVWRFLDIAQNKSIFNSFSDYRIIELDLEEVKQFSFNNHHSFSWERLRIDIENQLKSLLGNETQLVEWSFNKLLMLIPRLDATKKFNQILEWNDHFPIWKYFAQEDLYIPNEVKIKIDYFKSLLDEPTDFIEEEKIGSTSKKSFLSAPAAWDV